MKFLYFPGCKIPHFLPQYDRAVRLILEKLDVELIDVELNCCGYPVRHRSHEASVYSAARVIALASRHKADILTPCKCCYGSLKHALYWLVKSEGLRQRIGGLLDEEGLVLEPAVDIKHLLSVLKEDVGLTSIQEKIVHPFTGLKVAAHYGCHALRPAEVVAFDNPLAPTIFESLIEILGATAVDWSLRLECCGNPLWGKNNLLALKLMRNKLDNAISSGADILCTACTYCQIQFDTVRVETDPDAAASACLPAVLYPQLLGLSLGIDRLRLGVDQNAIPWRQ